MRIQMRRVVSGATAIGLAVPLTACGFIAGGDGGGGDTIGLLFPDNNVTRYEAFDRPLMEAKIAELCPECTVEHENADGDAALQKEQFETMLDQGVDVIVLDAVDSTATGPWVEQAAERGVRVLAYDRLAEGPVDVYVSYDNRHVGRLQGKALLDALGEEARDAPVVMINGSPTDPNAADFKAGAHEILDQVVEIVHEQDVDGWDPDTAQQMMRAAIQSLGENGFAAVYSANDGMAGAIIVALREAGVTDVPVGGQDAELGALQRIVSGDQTFTIYKALVPEAQTAAQIAVQLLNGKSIALLAPDTVNSPTDMAIPAALLAPVVVTEENIAETVLADGFYTSEEICTDAYKGACAELDIIG